MISDHVCERTDLHIAERNIIIKKNNTQPYLKRRSRKFPET